MVSLLRIGRPPPLFSIQPAFRLIREFVLGRGTETAFNRPTSPETQAVSRREPRFRDAGVASRQALVISLEK